MQPSTSDTASAGSEGRGRPRMATVFGTAFVAGALAAFGINRALDVHLAQARPQVECEPIFVALRSLPQGTPITVWDVALRDWPKAMLPTSALRAHDTFEGMVLRHPLREGQPLVAAQLVKADDPGSPARVAAEPAWPTPPAPAAESWTPARPETATTTAAAPQSVSPATTAVAMAPATTAPVTAEPPATVPAALPDAPATAAAELTAIEPAASESPPAVRIPREPTGSDPSPAPVIAADVAATGPRTAEPPVVTESTVAADVPAGPTATLADQSATAGDAVDELPPVDAATATVTDVVSDLPPVAPQDAPTPADPTLDRAVAQAPDVGPLAAPLPMSPPTDIASPLASITAARPRAAAPESSVLKPTDPATTAASTTPPSPAMPAEPATPAPPRPAAPLRYLVVPERIALQADASFVVPQPTGAITRSTAEPEVTANRDAPVNREPTAQQRPRNRSPDPASRSAGPAVAPSQRRPAAPSSRQAGPGRGQESAPKAGSWLPKLGFRGFGSSEAR